MSKKPPRWFKPEQVCCGSPLRWHDCGHRPGVPCPDCAGAGGWWEECPTCGKQPYGETLLKPPQKPLDKPAKEVE